MKRIMVEARFYMMVNDRLPEDLIVDVARLRLKVLVDAIPLLWRELPEPLGEIPEGGKK